MRFLLLYLTSIIGGSVAVLWLSEPGVPVVGASGALFGLMGAYFIVQRSIGGNPTQIFILIAINFAMGFFVEGISWQGHLGGLVTGLFMALVYANNRNPKQLVSRGFGVLLIWALLLGLSYLKIDQWV
jgi:membrane associated rhomboid family serine protease